MSSTIFLKIVAFVAVCIGTVLTPAAALLKGHDLPSAGIMETSRGATWRFTTGRPATIESILGGGGINSVRLRLWTSGDYNLTYTLSMAERFSKAGCKIYLNMHFPNNWTDPAKQAIPEA